MLSLAVPNGLRIEDLGDIISKDQSWLVLNLPVFMFVYIHFMYPRPEYQIWLEMYQMKRFIDMEHSLCLSVCFCFYQQNWFVFSQLYS